MELFTIIFSIVLVLSIVVSTKGLVHSMYLSKDNFVLLSFPTSKTQVFLSKFVVYFLYEIVRNMSFVMPMFLAFFMVNQYAWFYYLWLPMILIIYTISVLVISALLSIPTLFIVNFIRRRLWLELAVLCAILSIVVIGIIGLILLIPENLDIRASWGTTFWDIQKFMTNYSQNSKVFYFLLVALVGTRYGVAGRLFGGEQWINLTILILVITLISVATYFLIKPLFFRMASMGMEHRKKDNISKRKNNKHGVFVSLIKKEFLLSVRDSGRFYPVIITAIFLPLSILLLNKIYGAMDTRLAGNNMSIAFNILLILLIAMSSSVSVSKIISIEGASAYLNKISPQSSLLVISSKLVINAIIYSLSILISTIIFSSFSCVGVGNSICIFLSVECLYLSHLLFSVELDIMNPAILEYSTTGTIVSSRNENKSSVMATILSCLFAFLTYFFISENSSSVWWKLLLISILYLILRIYLYISKIQVFYKEK